MSFTPHHHRISVTAILLAALLLPGLLLAVPPRPTAAVAGTRAGQLVVVVTDDWDADHGQLYTFSAGNDRWHSAAAPFAVTIGEHGSAWGLGLHPAVQAGPHKREGDGRSPAGVFAIGPAFGAAERIDSAMPYQPMRASHWCIDIPDSPLYNRIVDAAQVGEAAVKGASEPMRRDLHKQGDQRYREGFVIEHNPDALAGQGSCIFAHLWRQPGESTAGCTAMEASAMQRLLAWLDPRATPRFVLLPLTEYQRLQAAWSLPTLPVAQ